MATLVEDSIVTGSVDYKRRPAIRGKNGTWRSSAFIIGVEMGERLSFYGISANLINFLTLKLGQSTANAAANVNTWTGVAFMLPILGGVIADTCLGKYYTIVVASIIYILGLGLLTLSAMAPSLNCTNAETSTNGAPKCSHHKETIIFFIALYMVAIGQGGHKPCAQAFGAEQFEDDDPKESKAKSSFFNWWYVGVCIGGLIGTAVLSYAEDNFSWALGFGIPCALMVFALLVFLLGTVTYRFSTKPEGPSPFRRIGRVFVAAARNWRKPYPELGYCEKMTRVESRQYRFLDKALIEPDTHGDGKSCSKSDVEEAKAVLRLFPIWATTLIFAIILAQPQTFFTKQGLTLNRSIGPKFEIPSAALVAINGLVIVIFLPIYDRLLVPLARNITGEPTGLSMLQRIGAGLFIQIICVIVAALVETKRVKTASQYGLIDSPKATIPMRIWWLLLQIAIFAISEALALVGLQEFFYSQVPNELRSVGMSLYLSVFGMGSLISGVLVSFIDKETSKGGRHSWFSSNLNKGHLDYFYWLLAGLSSFGLLLYMYFAKSYIYNKNKSSV